MQSGAELKDVVGVTNEAEIPDESTRCMRAGFLSMEREDWRGALAHFDRAVELREKLPWREEVEAAWMLAAAWMNRSDMLRKCGEVEEAVRSLDRGIEAMECVPLEERPVFAERMMLAWINRGTACGEAGRVDEALEGFGRAEAYFREYGERTTGERRFLASMLRVNRARVLLDGGRAEEGWREAREGVEILRELEPAAPVLAAGVKARSVACRALAMLLDEPDGAKRVEDWIAVATDLTEEALACVRASGGVDEWTADLVRYGARIYRACQPHFLGEFIVEWVGEGGPLADDAELKREMENELLLARAEVERRVLAAPHDTEWVEKQTKVLRALQRGEMGLKGAGRAERMGHGRADA